MVWLMESSGVGSLMVWCRDQAQCSVQCRAHHGLVQGKLMVRAEKSHGLLHHILVQSLML